MSILFKKELHKKDDDDNDAKIDQNFITTHDTKHTQKRSLTKEQKIFK